MHPVGFEPTISAGERPQTYTLDGAATGTDLPQPVILLFSNFSTAGRHEDGFKLQRVLLIKFFLDPFITFLQCGIWGSVWIVRACCERY
jgi:hypothetical protein